MTKLFVWERSMRGNMVAVYQPVMYHDGLPTNLKGEPMPEGTFVLVHRVRDDEADWGLLRFCETYPCPAERRVTTGKDKYANEPNQTREDINKAQARERVARHLDRTASSGQDRGSSTTHDNQADERSTQDQRGHNTERVGGNGIETQSPEVYSTGERAPQDGVASNDGDT